MKVMVMTVVQVNVDFNYDVRAIAVQSKVCCAG